jgi:translation initiation factor IF-2
MSAERVVLNLIIRADVRGSIEAIQKELSKLEHPEVQIKILQASVGGITVADATLAHASQAVIIGFNVIPDEAARALAEDRQVEIRRYDIIYKVTDDIRLLLEGKLKPEERVVELGQALVKQVFAISRIGAIAGCYVVRGSIERGCRIRVNRDGRTIGDYPLESLRREKDDIKEVARGLECGIKLSGFNDVKKDDVLEAYKIEEVARTL